MRADLASHWPELAQHVIHIFLWKGRSWAKLWGGVGGVASLLKINLRSYIISECESIADRCQGRVFEILEFNVRLKKIYILYINIYIFWLAK